MTEIPDDGFRATDIGAFRWRVHTEHEAKAIRAIKRRWKQESEARAA